MRLALSLLASLLLVVVAIGQPRNPNVSDAPPLEPDAEIKQFTVPPGFEVQLVASEPMIDKPMNLAFDDRGRLWVTCSVEYPFAANGDKGRDRVVILEDFAPNGRARKATTWRNDLNIPIGLLPLSGAKTPTAIVHSIPNVWTTRDTTGNGQADERTVLLRGYGFEDTHGMTSAFTQGFDGWIYACHGFKNTSKIQGGPGTEITLNSGNTYRFSPDGKALEQFTWGQVNPFGLALDPRGNYYSADCHSRPVYQLIRGAYYPSFGKPHDGLGFAPEMIRHDHGSTAICGIVYYDADHFPAEYRDTLFIGNVVTNRINFDRIQWQGTSPVAVERPDFLVSKDPWFRPVDIKLGPDGALYVADFYNRIIGHYEVDLKHPGRDRHRGRIWRIVYKGEGTKAAVDPRPNADRADSKELIADLGHANIVVRMRATNLLSGRKDHGATEALRVLASGKAEGGSWGAAHAHWVLERRGELDAAMLQSAVTHSLEAVRLHTGHILAERAKLNDANRKQIHALLADASPHVQRAAVGAAGRHPGIDNVRPLLDLRARVPANDTHLVHTVRIALRNQLLDGSVFEQLGILTPAEEATLADVVLGVRTPEAAAFLLSVLPRLKVDGLRLIATVNHIARHGKPEVVEKLILWARGATPTDQMRQVAILKAIEKGSQERGQVLPASARIWAAELVPLMLKAKEATTVQAAGELVGSLKLREAEPQLITLAARQDITEGARLAVLGALATLDAKKHAALIGKVLLDGSLAIELRERTAEILARTNESTCRQQLVTSLAAAPSRLQTTIAANLAGTREGAESLLASVATGKASPRLLREKAVEVKLQQSKLGDWQARVAKLTQGLPAADQRLAELIGQRSKGFITAKPDPVRGKQVYVKRCANCHQIGGEGAKVGPQLDGVGVRGLERLVEDTLDPNRNIDAAFRMTVLNLKNGQVLSGLVLREEGEVLVLADNLGKEVRVPKAGIEERAVAAQSPMPANLIDQIPEAEYYHLVAYLLTQRPKE